MQNRCYIAVLLFALLTSFAFGCSEPAAKEDTVKDTCNGGTILVPKGWIFSDCNTVRTNLRDRNPMDIELVYKENGKQAAMIMVAPCKQYSVEEMDEIKSEIINAEDPAQTFRESAIKYIDKRLELTSDSYSQSYVDGILVVNTSYNMTVLDKEFKNYYNSDNIYVDAYRIFQPMQRCTITAFCAAKDQVRFKPFFQQVADSFQPPKPDLYENTADHDRMVHFYLGGGILLPANWRYITGEERRENARLGVAEDIGNWIEVLSYSHDGSLVADAAILNLSSLEDSQKYLAIKNAPEEHLRQLVQRYKHEIATSPDGSLLMRAEHRVINNAQALIIKFVRYDLNPELAIRPDINREYREYVHYYLNDKRFELQLRCAESDQSFFEPVFEKMVNSFTITSN